MRLRCRMGLLLLAGSVCLGTAGCTKVPETLALTDWKVVWLKTPEGTEYDEAAFDMLAGETYYHFGEGGMLVCDGGDGTEELSYQYTYDNGNVAITGGGVDCTGKVSDENMELILSEKGRARLELLQDETAGSEEQSRDGAAD